jgi:UDP-3-O-[3-hydroxymyristoyl] glucosamine N-acyltransferase
MPSVSEVADFLGDRVLSAKIAEDRQLVGQASLSPGAPGCLTFASRRNEETASAVATTQCAVVLALPDYVELAGAATSVIAVDDPRLEFARCVQHFFVSPPTPGIHPSAVIHETAQLGAGAAVGPGAVIGADCRIGERVQIGANVVLGERLVIGDDVVIGPGTVIGHVGFGYAREADGTPVLLPHTGTVRIGDRIEIGANTAIDRGTIDDTVIEADAKIDNLVHVAHNCHIGAGAFVIATAILCGGVKIGEQAWVAPNVAVREQLTVGANATVGLSATVVKDVPEGSVVTGSPATEVNRSQP